MTGTSAVAEDAPSWYQPVGVALALMSGLFIGLSLILQKKGHIETKEASLEAGNEHAYLRNPLWWFGMLCMALGEGCNFAAYAFAPTILVTPLGAVSVVVSAILSVIFLKEKLNFSGTAGICLCIIGATIIVLHGPHSTVTNTIPAFMAYVLAPGFLTFSCICFIIIIYLIFTVAPRYGHVHPLVYISVTSIVGAFLVNAAQGFGASLLYTFSNWNTDNQFLQWPIYPLVAFVGFTVFMQVNYLNKALGHFSTSIVTPVYFVYFSSATLVTSAVLYQGFNVASVTDGITIVLGFLVIVIGVALLFQYNLKINKLQMRLIEDINDADNDDEEQQNDQNPLKMMNESFPLHPKSRQNRSLLPESNVPGSSSAGAGSGVGASAGSGADGMGRRSDDGTDPSGSSTTYVRKDAAAPHTSVATAPITGGITVGIVQQAAAAAASSSHPIMPMISVSSTSPLTPQPQPTSQTVQQQVAAVAVTATSATTITSAPVSVPFATQPLPSIQQQAPAPLPVLNNSKNDQNETLRISGETSEADDDSESLLDLQNGDWNQIPPAFRPTSSTGPISQQQQQQQQVQSIPVSMQPGSSTQSSSQAPSSTMSSPVVISPMSPTSTVALVTDSPSTTSGNMSIRALPPPIWRSTAGAAGSNNANGSPASELAPLRGTRPGSAPQHAQASQQSYSTQSTPSVSDEDRGSEATENSTIDERVLATMPIVQRTTPLSQGIPVQILQPPQPPHAIMMIAGASASAATISSAPADESESMTEESSSQMPDDGSSSVVNVHVPMQPMNVNGMFGNGSRTSTQVTDSQSTSSSQQSSIPPPPPMPPTRTQMQVQQLRQHIVPLPSPIRIAGLVSRPGANWQPPQYTHTTSSNSQLHNSSQPSQHPPPPQRPAPNPPSYIHTKSGLSNAIYDDDSRSDMGGDVSQDSQPPSMQSSQQHLQSSNTFQAPM